MVVNVYLNLSLKTRSSLQSQQLVSACFGVVHSCHGTHPLRCAEEFMVTKTTPPIVRIPSVSGGLDELRRTSTALSAAVPRLLLFSKSAKALEQIEETAQHIAKKTAGKLFVFAVEIKGSAKEGDMGASLLVNTGMSDDDFDGGTNGVAGVIVDVPSPDEPTQRSVSRLVLTSTLTDVEAVAKEVEAFLDEVPPLSSRMSLLGKKSGKSSNRKRKRNKSKSRKNRRRKRSEL